MLACRSSKEASTARPPPVLRSGWSQIVKKGDKGAEAEAATPVPDAKQEAKKECHAERKGAEHQQQQHHIVKAAAGEPKATSAVQQPEAVSEATCGAAESAKDSPSICSSGSDGADGHEEGEQNREVKMLCMYSSENTLHCAYNVQHHLLHVCRAPRSQQSQRGTR